uniref:Cation/H+ exchanger transmembrane domain-containing protein n=1 Tax=Canis lupus familiaris TaxID=9615 RepID=A0A8C0TI47_CANLF
MDLNYTMSNFTLLTKGFPSIWLEFLRNTFINASDDLPKIILVLSLICTVGGEIVGMSGIFTLAIMGLFLNSTSFKPGVEVLLLEFWNCLSFVAFLMVFTFIGLLIPAHTYLYVSFYDIYYSLNIYFTLIVLRLLVFLLLSPLLSRFGHGFSWRWAFIMVWSEMKGTPNINMALLLAYSDLSFGNFIIHIKMVVSLLLIKHTLCTKGLHDVTSTKYKSLHCTFQHFQELTKSAASALKFDKDLANADWNMVEKAIRLQNPYALSQGDTTEHQKVKCLDCNREIDETLNIEAMELANRRLLSAQIASYQRQYRNETLSQSAAQVLVGAAGSFGEKKEKYMSPETIKHYSESKKLLAFIRKVLLNWVYNTKKEKGIPSRYYFLRVCHKIVFTDEFEYVGYLVTLMNMFPIIISWIPKLSDIYEHELRHSNYSFLVLYIMEALLKLITPKLLQIIDQKMSHQQSFQYAILKGYVQGEADIMTIIDQISTSKHVKQVLLRRITKNTGNAMKELGYLEYDHPEIAVTMKTKEEINVMLNLAREIVRVFKSKGIIHKIESTEINKLIMAKKKEILDFQPVIKPLTVVEALHHIPWLDKDKEYITFIQLQRSKPSFGIDQMESEEKDYQMNYTDFLISGEIIGELNCLTNKPMTYSATCKTVVETCFIPKNYLYEAFEQCSPHIEYKMWLKLGLSITAKKIREHLSYEDWNYKMQLKLCNVSVKDIPKNIKTGIYDETVIYVILIHGAVEDCQLRKAYKAPSLIPITCYQVQGTEDFTKVMIVQTSVDLKNFRWNTRKYVPSRKPSLPTCKLDFFEIDYFFSLSKIPAHFLHNPYNKRLFKPFFLM